MQQYQQETIELGNKRNQTRLLEQIDDLSIQQQQQLLINILHQPYQERKSEILQILRHIMWKVDLLQQFHQQQIDNEAYDYCLKHLTIDNYSKNSVIFEKGEYAYNIYIVIKGQVSLFSNDHLVDQSKSRKHSFSVDFGRDSQHSNRIKYSDFKIKSLIRLCEYKEWKTFGEQAIIEERLRTNIAVCDQDSVLAILSKEYYLNAISIMEKKIEQNKMNSFKLNPSFQGLNKKLINLLLFTFQSHEYKFRDIIYKKGLLDSDTFYIIKSGEFLVYTLENQIIRKQISILTSGEMFGDYEAFEKIPRQFSVQCNSHHGSLIVIPFQQLTQKLSQFNEQNHLQQLRNLSINKNKLYQEFKVNIDQAQGKFQQFLKVQETSRNTTISCSQQRIDSQQKEEIKQSIIEPSIQPNPITELKNTLNFLTQIEELPQNTDQGDLKTRTTNVIPSISPEKIQILPKIKLVTNKIQERTGLSTPERFGQIIQEKMSILKKIHNLSPEKKVNLKTLQYKTIHVQMPKQVKMELKIEKQWPIDVQLYLNDLDDRMRYHNNSTCRNNRSCQERSVDQSTFSKYEEEYNTERAGKMQVLNNILQQSVTKRGKQKKRRALTLKYREYLESKFPQKSQISLLFS